MTNGTILALSANLFEFPLLLIYIVGLVISIRKFSQNPSIAKLAVGIFSISILTVVLGIGISVWSYNYQFSSENSHFIDTALGKSTYSLKPGVWDHIQSVNTFGRTIASLLTYATWVLVPIAIFKQRPTQNA